MTTIQYKQKILSFIKQEETEYDAQVRLLKRYYELGKKFLLESNPNAADLRDMEEDKYFTFLINFCKTAALFADKPIIKKLRSLGVDEKVTRWFIPIEKIEESFKRIGKKDILLLKNIALKSIMPFLGSKIRTALYQQAEAISKIKKEYANDLTRVTVKMYRRREYSNGSSRRNMTIFDSFIDKQAIYFENVYGERKAAKMNHVKLIEGKTETIHLKELLRSFIPIPKIEQTEFLACISGIFKLISKDRVIWSKAKYEDRESSYENNYKRYLAMRVKKITGYDPKTDDFRNILVH